MHDPFIVWFLLIGTLFIVLALTGSVLKRLPITGAILYLLLGIGIGTFGYGLVSPDPFTSAGLLERVTEVAVIISLFTAGLKLSTPLSDVLWRIPIRLAFISMLLTVAMVTAVGVTLLSLPLGAAVLLGAILAPTDPVLASDVQVESPFDRERLRFSLTGEAGMNDGTAFPFVMLGLGLLGLHEIGGGWRWLFVDVLWAVPAGLGVGWLLGTVVASLVIFLRREHREAVGLDDFLALGLVALSYGMALLVHAYGFLAVFAAGLALRRVERMSSGEKGPEDVQAALAVGQAEEVATDPEKAPAYMASAVLGFNEQLERIGEVAVVLLLGTMLSPEYLSFEVLWFAPLLFLVIRPLSVLVGLIGTGSAPVHQNLISWFGIRGIGSFYYLTYAVARGVPEGPAQHLISLTLSIVAVSIIVHGVSVTPLMNWYGRIRKLARWRDPVI